MTNPKTQQAQAALATAQATLRRARLAHDRAKADALEARLNLDDALTEEMPH